MIQNEITTSKETLFKGKIVELELHDVDINGRRAKREIVKHSEGVTILCKKDDKFIFLEQFRKPFDKEILELPAGKVDEGEDTLKAAVRELREETGLKPNHIEKIGEYLSSPGFTDEKVHLFYATDVVEDPLPKDEDEHFNTYYLQKEEVLNLINKGELIDGKSLCAFLLWIQKYDER